MKVLFLDIDGVLNSTQWWERRDKIDSFDPNEWTSMFDRCVWDIDPEGLEMLEDIVERTDCMIVVSSSWRVLHSLDSIWSTLNETAGVHRQRGTTIARSRIIGKTPDAWKDFSSTPSDWGSVRGTEIAAWLKEHPEVTSYAIVDDDGDMLEEQKGSHFVKTSHETGLTKLGAERLIDYLNNRTI